MLMLGNFLRKLDSKNRLVLPATLRRALPQAGSEVVLTRGLDPCLYLITSDYWQTYVSNLVADLSDRSVERRALVHRLASQAESFALDKVGRILLPSSLKEAAGIRQEAMVVGVVDRIELWEPAAWRRYLEGVEQRIGAALPGDS